MKRSFFGPVLFLGIVILLGGFCGLSSNCQDIEAGERSLEEFVARYQDGNDYDALFRAALAIYEKANFLQGEYTAYPAAGGTLGLLLILWAFERRKLFRRFAEMKLQLDNTSRLVPIAQKEAQLLPSKQPRPISDSPKNLPADTAGASGEPQKRL